MSPLTPRQVSDYTKGRPRSCQLGYCHLWLFSARVDIGEREILEKLLSADERERADRFHFARDRTRFIVARGGLRLILSSYCSAPPQRLEFQTDSYGKPALLGPSAAMEFNVSHSGDYVLVGVTAGVPCGVDIELGRADMEELAIAQRFFCAREVEWLSRTEKGFLRLWTAKEAVIKAVGRGVSIPLSDVDVTDVVEGKTSSITLRSAGMEPQTLWLNELSLVPNYAAALATVEEKCIVHLIGGTDRTIAIGKG
jgi:4'-phosphopantetheinyl transferase